MKKFWMVLLDGTDSCRHKHETLEAAKIEAERLLHQAQKSDYRRANGVTILEAVERGSMEWPPVTWELT